MFGCCLYLASCVGMLVVVLLVSGCSVGVVGVSFVMATCCCVGGIDDCCW